MSAGQEIRTAVEDRQWFIVGRWQEYEGEGRANLLRIIAIGVFYAIELVNFRNGNVTEEFHRAITALAVAWTMVALATLLCLRRQIFPAGLKFVSTICDLLFLSGVLIIADGPQSPMVIGYFLIIVLATLRFSLRLVWLATLGSMIGYVYVLGATHPDWFGSDVRNFVVPRYAQATLLAGLALTGVILGQVIRRVRSLAEQYAERIVASGGKSTR